MSEAGRVRVLIVDDSAFVRKVVRHVLIGAGMDVVGIARDGLDALEKVERLRPDVVTLDLMMPHLDGLGVLEALETSTEPPAVVVVSIAGAQTEAGVEALQRGAVAVVEKPTALATPQLYELGEELAEQVQLAARTRPRSAPALRSGPTGAAPPADRPWEAAHTDLVVLGTSTGGPQALTQLLAALPESFPVPLVVALHIPRGYTAALAERLNASSPMRVVEAANGTRLQPGQATIAQAGSHLSIRRRGENLIARLGVEPVLAPHHPSVDVLFRSAAEVCGDRVVGVVLTGMGDDGLEGARRIRAGGGRILTEAEASCVVYGMPRAVADAGLSDAVAPLRGVPAAIRRLL